MGLSGRKLEWFCARAYPSTTNTSRSSGYVPEAVANLRALHGDPALFGTLREEPVVG
jgi:hypothetical protein